MVLHIVTSVALLGEVWALVALNIYATVAADGEPAHSAYRLMEVLVFAGGIPLSMTALIAGVTLALGTHWGLLRHHWIVAKLLLLVAVIVCGMFLFQPAPMADATATGTVSATEQWRQVAVVRLPTGDARLGDRVVGVQAEGPDAVIAAFSRLHLR